MAFLPSFSPYIYPRSPLDSIGIGRCLDALSAIGEHCSLRGAAYGDAQRHIHASYLYQPYLLALAAVAGKICGRIVAAGNVDVLPGVAGQGERDCAGANFAGSGVLLVPVSG